MTVRLVLITHAATSATRESRFPDDEPLDEHGTAAARSVGALRRIETAFRGPEARCAQTAEALSLEATAHPLLADLDLGSWRGRTLGELEQDAPADLFAWLGDPEATPHGGESLRALLDRVAEWLRNIPAGRVAAVTHPSVVRAAVLLTLGAPATCFWRLDTTPLSQTRLSRNGDSWRLRETGHPL
jgi:broad specificity phosphatase PhoE